MTPSLQLSRGDLRALPRFARVAFAAKCGRRVQNLLRIFMPTLEQQVFDVFERALVLAERVGAKDLPTDSLADAANEAHRYASALIGLAQMCPPGSSPKPVPAANIVAYNVGNAVAACARAADAATRQDDETASDFAFDAYSFADSAARCANAAGIENVMHYDFQILRQAAERGELNDESPVSQGFSGYDRELQTYSKELPKLLAYEGRFVAIRGQEIVGPVQTYEDALEIGYERFGLQPFLVKRIEETETVYPLPSRLGSECPI
ncbi:MAG TPA: hypothetical protein VK395_37945 [Gemmataceae bacterium]|nr:hypothetical protein [Gemmataceae bacterium]